MIVLLLPEHASCAYFQEVKHKLLFILEMLDPFIDHGISVMKDTISFGGVSAMYLDKQEKSCGIALNIIRTAAKSPAVLPSLELEWRRGAVAPRLVSNTCRCNISLRLQ